MQKNPKKQHQLASFVKDRLSVVTLLEWLVILKIAEKFYQMNVKISILIHCFVEKKFFLRIKLQFIQRFIIARNFFDEISCTRLELTDWKFIKGQLTRQYQNLHMRHTNANIIFSFPKYYDIVFMGCLILFHRPPPKNAPRRPRPPAAAPWASPPPICPA